MAELPQRSSPPPSRGSGGSTRWFCTIGDQKHGPMDFRNLRALALDRKLLGHHKVWRMGTDDLRDASTIVGLIPASKKKVEEPPSSDVSDNDPYAPPKTRTIADGPPGGLYLPHLHPANFFVYLLTLAITIGLFVGATMVPEPDTRPIVLSVATLALMFWIFFTVIYLHRAWEMMKMFGAPMSGAKAVRFIFFPLFNALWCFVALFGWAKLWNHSVNTHPGLAPARKVWKPFFFAFPILFLISQTLVVMHFFINEWPTDPSNQSHLISMVIGGITTFTGLICWFQLTRSINFLARKKS